MEIVYLAGPLFTLAEREFNLRLAKELGNCCPGCEVILPQERAEKLLKQENGPELVFRDCFQMIDKSDVVVSILDGADADSGTCIELGYAFARNIPVIGIRTDFRASEHRGLNLMVSHVCSVLISAYTERTPELATKITTAIENIIARSPQAASRNDPSV